MYLTTDISTETALAFAEYCLGWRQVLHGKDASGRDYPVVWSIFEMKELKFTDFNAVMKAVCDWCDRNGYGFEISYSPESNNYLALCEGVETQDGNPCQALLSVCVEVNRRAFYSRAFQLSQSTDL